MDKNIFSPIRLILFSLVFCLQSHAFEGYLEDNSCCSSPKFWVDVDYLCWEIKDSPKIDPLVVQSTSAVIEFSPVLAINLSPLAGNNILIGGNRIKDRIRSGIQGTAGCFFDDCLTWGGEVSYFILEKRSKNKSVHSSGLLGTPILVLPFFDTSVDLESSTPLAAARPITSGLSSPFGGTMSLRVSNDMQGAELNGLWNMGSLASYCGCNSSACYGCNNGSCSEVYFIGGFRYWNFNEYLTFDVNIPNTLPPIDVFQTSDKFDVRNNFYGGQIGLKCKYFFDKFYVKATGKVAFGAMCEELKIKGHLLTNDFNNPPFTGTAEIFPGGYLAFPTNQGKHTKTMFAIMPEVDVSLGYKILDCLDLEVGYTFFYVNKMMRATNQIDRNINSTQAPAITAIFPTTLEGPATPEALLKTTSFWAQGLTVGLDFSF